MNEDKRFGAYLLEAHVIDHQQLEEAVHLQKQHHLLIGELGIQRGYFSLDDVGRIMLAQGDDDTKFGALAIQMQIINDQQLEELLQAQADNHFYLGESLLSLGYISSKEDLFRHLARFKALLAPKLLPLDESLWPELDRHILRELLEQIYEFFYNEGYIIELFNIKEQSPPKGDYVAYSVKHTVCKKEVFKKNSYVVSLLLPVSWNRIINNEFYPGAENSFDNVAQMTFSLNDLFSKRLRKLNYDCDYGAVQIAIPHSRECLVMRFETSIEPLFLLLAKIPADSDNFRLD